MKHKALIIAHPRSGSRSLMLALANCFDAIAINEPWNPVLYKLGSEKNIWAKNPADPLDLPTNAVIKSLADNMPFYYDNSTEYDRINFYMEYINRFELVILLKRRNKQDFYESFQYCVENNVKNWHEKWTYSETEITDFTKGVYEYEVRIIDELSNNLGIPITWYEDIYSGDRERIESAISSWGVNVDCLWDYINPDLRLRQNP